MLLAREFFCFGNDIYIAVCRIVTLSVIDTLSLSRTQSLLQCFIIIIIIIIIIEAANHIALARPYIEDCFCYWEFYEGTKHTFYS